MRRSLIITAVTIFTTTLCANISLAAGGTLITGFTPPKETRIIVGGNDTAVADDPLRRGDSDVIQVDAEGMRNRCMAGDPSAPGVLDRMSLGTLNEQRFASSQDLLVSLRRLAEQIHFDELRAAQHDIRVMSGIESFLNDSDNVVASCLNGIPGTIPNATLEGEIRFALNVVQADPTQNDTMDELTRAAMINFMQLPIAREVSEEVAGLTLAVATKRMGAHEAAVTCQGLRQHITSSLEALQRRILTYANADTHATLANMADGCQKAILDLCIAGNPHAKSAQGKMSLGKLNEKRFPASQALLVELRDLATAASYDELRTSRRTLKDKRAFDAFQREFSQEVAICLDPIPGTIEGLRLEGEINFALNVAQVDPSVDHDMDALTRAAMINYMQLPVSKETSEEIAGLTLAIATKRIETQEAAATCVALRTDLSTALKTVTDRRTRAHAMDSRLGIARTNVACSDAHTEYQIFDSPFNSADITLERSIDRMLRGKLIATTDDDEEEEEEFDCGDDDAYVVGLITGTSAPRIHGVICHEFKGGQGFVGETFTKMSRTVTSYADEATVDRLCPEDFILHRINTAFTRSEYAQNRIDDECGDCMELDDEGTVQYDDSGNYLIKASCKERSVKAMFAECIQVNRYGPIYMTNAKREAEAIATVSVFIGPWGDASGSEWMSGFMPKDRTGPIMYERKKDCHGTICAHWTYDKVKHLLASECTHVDTETGTRWKMGCSKITIGSERDVIGVRSRGSRDSLAQQYVPNIQLVDQFDNAQTMRMDGLKRKDGLKFLTTNGLHKPDYAAGEADIADEGLVMTGFAVLPERGARASGTVWNLPAHFYTPYDSLFMNDLPREVLSGILGNMFDDEALARNPEDHPLCAGEPGCAESIQSLLHGEVMLSIRGDEYKSWMIEAFDEGIDMSRDHFSSYAAVLQNAAHPASSGYYYLESLKLSDTDQDGLIDINASWKRAEDFDEWDTMKARAGTVKGWFNFVDFSGDEGKKRALQELNQSIVESYYDVDAYTLSLDEILDNIAEPSVSHNHGESEIDYIDILPADWDLSLPIQYLRPIYKPFTDVFDDLYRFDEDPDGVQQPERAYGYGTHQDALNDADFDKLGGAPSRYLCPPGHVVTGSYRATKKTYINSTPNDLNTMVAVVIPAVAPLILGKEQERDYEYLMRIYDVECSPLIIANPNDAPESWTWTIDTEHHVWTGMFGDGFDKGSRRTMLCRGDDNPADDSLAVAVGMIGLWDPEISPAEMGRDCLPGECDSIQKAGLICSQLAE